ncbi:hypothetical protein GSI_08924 [Ganoderma sinense ZZ0214-1]|uniref:Uncharacterized protein n=1 Tax=Ganoderma sinense ZZ0214-1 TaxID=1077348 RepID=A0A2G8S5R6_9APHY|nr:hypothetical protein GSI_08924 [Ganoderma sinense ZZ0214-1]
MAFPFNTPDDDTIHEENLALANDTTPATQAVPDPTVLTGTINTDPTAAIFDAVAVAAAVTASPGPLPRLELLEDYYTYINGAHLRTIVLRIVGRNSVSQYVLPTSNLGLRQLPIQQFVRWVRAFERGEFGIPDALSPAQRRLLVDFARTWEFFARTPFVHRDWEVFADMLRSMASSPWSHTEDGTGDGGYAQLSALSDWARNSYPAWFNGNGINAVVGGGQATAEGQDGEASDGGDSDSDGSIPSLVDEYTLSDGSLD